MSSAVPGSPAGGAARIQRPRDFWAGVLFSVIGIATVAMARRYSFGTTASMGPGYFPAILGGLMTVLGLIVGGRSFLRPHGEEPPVTSGFKPRPLVVILAAVVAFAAALPKLGLVVASVLLVVSSRLAAPGFRAREVAVLAVLLTAFCAAVFLWGLKMPMRLWPALPGS